jgi:hypothetical protein
MRAQLLPLVVVVALAAAAPAWAAGGDKNMAQTTRALSQQALALIEQGRSHEEAAAKLDEALASNVPGKVNLRAIRAAHEALHAEDVARARQLLQHAFPGEDSHVVGVTFRPQIETAQVAAGITGAFVLALAGGGLLWRRRVDARRTAAADAARSRAKPSGG